MMSVSPPRCERKARELNPHPLAGTDVPGRPGNPYPATFRKAGAMLSRPFRALDPWARPRRAAKACHPVERQGIEP
jgi:hypothetical protein